LVENLTILLQSRSLIGSCKTDKDLLLGAGRTQRCAGEGELVFGLTKHVVSLSGAMAGGKGLFCPYFARSARLLQGFSGRF
jgi:hypothetical protein